MDSDDDTKISRASLVVGQSAKVDTPKEEGEEEHDEQNEGEDEIHEFVLPPWFLLTNVLRAQDLASVDSGLTLLEQETKLDGEQGKTKDNEYLARPDVIGPARQSRAILLAGDDKAFQDPWQKIMMHLSKDMGAHLISMNLDDLEDLAWSFNFDHGKDDWQTKCSAEFSDASSSSGTYECEYDQYYGRETASFEYLADDYFREATAEHAAVLSIMNAVSETRGSIDGGSDAEDTAPRPLFILLRNGEAFGKRGDFLQSIRKTVEANVKVQQTVLFVSTFMQSNASPTSFVEGCSCSACRPRRSHIQKELQVGLPLWVKLKRIGSSEPEVAHQVTDKNSNCDRISTRLLKRLLRYRLLEQQGSSELFSPFSPWTIGTLLEGQVASMKWGKSELWKAAQQISGRARSIGSVALADVTDVLRRLARKYALTASTSGAHAGHEKKPSDEKGFGDAIDFPELLMNVAGECRDHEAELLTSVVDPDSIQTTFDDIVMDEETKAIIRQMLSLSKFKAEGRSHKLLASIRIMGLLFYGPPGTGKTHLARAIAKDTKANMLSVNPAKLQNMFVGESEKMIAAAFSLARKLHPCVIFIDEVDALFYRRGSSDKSWERNFITQFLQEMDGLLSGSTDTAPLVIGATNRPSDLDDAFLRRMPHKILFKMPCFEEREKIMKILVDDSDLDPLVTHSLLAQKTPGYSGSDLKNLCDQAVLSWAIEQTNTGRETAELLLKAEHFDSALRRIRPTVSNHSIQEIQEFANQYELWQPVVDGKKNPKPPPVIRAKGKSAAAFRAFEIPVDSLD